TDTGHGMTPEVKARIFDPFYTTKATGKGTGLGLSVTHGIVEQSAGHIEVDTEVDRGTTFRIFLPTTEEAAAAPRGRAPAAETRGSETVLVVEDEDALRRVAVRILRRGGYQTLEACDGAAALGILGGHPGKVDLVLTDVVMPG